jgi:hypothetical protein
MKPVEAAPEMRKLLRRPENAAFLEFYEYWQRKGAGKGLPARADIDPLDIPRLPAGADRDRAAAERDAVTEQLTGVQLGEALRRAREWTPSAC